MNGNEKQQSAWTKYTFDHYADEILDIAIIEDYCYVLIDDGSTTTLERFSLRQPAATTGWPYAVHLDRRQTVTGSYAGGDTSWGALELGTDPSKVRIVLGPDFAEPGTVLTPDSVNDLGVTISGDYTDGEVMIGLLYDASLELSRPYRYDREGNADLDAFLSVNRISAAVKNTGHLQIKSTLALRSDRTKTYEPATIAAYDLVRAWHGGLADELTTYLESTSPKPLAVTAVEWNVDYEPQLG